jgi:hypothetical protein
MTRTKFSLSILIAIMLLLAACSGGEDQAATETAESDSATAVARGLQQTSEARSAEETQAAGDADAAAEQETQTAIEAAAAAEEAADAAAQDAINAAGTQQAESGMDEINAVLQDVGLSTNSGSLAWTQSSPVVLTLPAGPATRYESISGSESYGNFVIHYNVTWDTSGYAGCSLLFRAEEDLDDGQYYEFNTLRFSGAPGWDVELYDNGSFQSSATGNIKFSKKMDLDNGATNNYVLIAEDSLLTVYINGNRASSVTVFARSEGRFAYEAWQQDGSTTCTFEDGWIWELP